MEPQLTERPAFTVIGIRRRGRHAQGDIPELWSRFNARRSEIGGAGAGAYGVEGTVDPITGEWDYLAGVQVDPAAPVPEGMARWDIPAQTYAVFGCTLTTLRQGYDRFVTGWLPRSGYRRAPGPEFEYYGADYDPQNDDSPLSVYISLAPRADG